MNTLSDFMTSRENGDDGEGGDDDGEGEDDDGDVPSTPMIPPIERPSRHTRAEVNALAEALEDESSDDEEHFFDIVRTGDAELVGRFIEHGADPTETINSFTALHYAARYGYLDVLKVLVEHGADVNAVCLCLGCYWLIRCLCCFNCDGLEVMEMFRFVLICRKV